MSFKPVDLQVLVPKVIEAAKVQQSHKTDVEGRKDLLMDQFQKQLNTERQKVNEHNKSSEIKLQPRNHSKDEKNNKDKNKKKKKQHNTKSKGYTKSHIDIRI